MDFNLDSHGSMKVRIGVPMSVVSLKEGRKKADDGRRQRSAKANMTSAQCYSMLNLRCLRKGNIFGNFEDLEQF